MARVVALALKYLGLSEPGVPAVTDYGHELAFGVFVTPTQQAVELAQVAEAAKNYRVYYAKHPEAGGDYSMDHSSIIYVMDPKGRFTASFTGEAAPFPGDPAAAATLPLAEP